MIKQADDLVTESTFNGQRWAGIHLNDRGDYSYDEEKMIASANFKNVAGLSADEYYMKLTSILYLLPNKEKSYELVRKFMRHMFPDRPTLSRKKALKLLTGRESGLQAKTIKVPGYWINPPIRYRSIDNGIVRVLPTPGVPWNAAWIAMPPNEENVKWCINALSVFDDEGNIAYTPEWGPYPDRVQVLTEYQEIQHWITVLISLQLCVLTADVGDFPLDKDIFHMLIKEIDYMNDNFRWATCMVECAEFYDTPCEDEWYDYGIINQEMEQHIHYFKSQVNGRFTVSFDPLKDVESVRNAMLHVTRHQLQGLGIKLCSIARLNFERQIVESKMAGKNAKRNRARREKKKAAKRLEKKVERIEHKVEQAARAKPRIVSVMKAAGRQGGWAPSFKPKMPPGRVNPYLKCIIDPSSHQCRYPDHFSGRTGLAKTIIEQDMKLGALSSFRGIVLPQLKNALIMSTNDADDTSGSTDWGDYWYDLTPDSSKHTYFSGSHIDFDEALFQCPQSGVMPFVKNPDGKYDKTKFDLTLSSLAPTAVDFGSESVIETEGGGGTWKIELEDSTGAVSTLCDQTSKGTMTKRSPAVGATWARLKVTCNKDIKILGMNFKIFMPIAINKDSRFTRYSFPDVDGAVNLFDSYRVVSQSLQITFFGDTVYDGGRVAGYYYRGENSLVQGDLLDLGTISTRPNSYSGPLREGLYMVWRPAKELDMQFRDPDNDYLQGGLPVLIFAGKADHNTSTIRVRITTVYEYETSSCLVDTEFSHVYPQWITEAMVALQGFPYAMGNPIHVKEIKNFLSNLVNKGRNAWNKASPYINGALQFGKSIAPLIEGMALL